MKNPLIFSAKNIKIEYFEDINNNKVWDQAEEYRDINNNGQYDEKKISYLGIIPDQDIIYSVKLKDQDSVIHVPSYYYKKLSKKNKVKLELSPYDLSRGRLTYRYK